ncbi:hypothetical protein ACJX0J_007828 [Zea mays]
MIVYILYMFRMFLFTSLVVEIIQIENSTCTCSFQGHAVAYSFQDLYAMCLLMYMIHAVITRIAIISCYIWGFTDKRLAFKFLKKLVLRREDIHEINKRTNMQLWINKHITKKIICYYMLWRPNGLDLVHIS